MLEDELNRAQRELMAMQQILAYVLDAYGKPVAISKDDLVGGKYAGKRIDISAQEGTNDFIVSLVDENE